MLRRRSWSTALILMFLLSVPLMAAAGAKVDINSASAEQLAAMLDGVGAARAEAIVEYRERNGGFASVDELTEVSGIGPSTLESNRSLLTVDGVQ